MKKRSLLITTIALLTLTGCTLKTNEWWIMNDEWWTLPTGSQVMNDTMPYSGELTIAGVGPDESFEPNVAAGTLVLKRTFEDHADHIFIDRQSRSNYLDIQDDLIPGNTVKFAGTTKALDAAAGNHYYQVVTIDELKVVGQPSQADVENLIQQYGYCETDDDCIGIYGQCPLSCHIAINKNYQTTVEKIITNFWNHQSPQCTYKCPKITKVGCDNYKCIVE